MTVSTMLLPRRQCHLDLDRHVYVHEPSGEEMNASVTGVVNWFKPLYAGPPEASWRGTHIHRAMEALALGAELPDPTSPEGIDCSAWFEQIKAMRFWNQIEVLGCEYTMTKARKSLGGQLDLLCRYKGKTLLVDLKTKGSWWENASKDDKADYAAQAGGYLELLQAGDGAHNAPMVDQCRTLVVSPTQVKWLSSMDPDQCSLAWDECWGAYCVDIRNKF